MDRKTKTKDSLTYLLSMEGYNNFSMSIVLLPIGHKRNH